MNATMQTSGAPSWSALRRRDLRKHRRYTIQGGVMRASWLDPSGQLKMAMVRVLNISKGGCALELPEPPQPNSLVRIQIDRLRIGGTAQVKHARRLGSKYVVGLEFKHGIGWDPPEGDVIEPIPLFQV